MWKPMSPGSPAARRGVRRQLLLGGPGSRAPWRRRRPGRRRRRRRAGRRPAAARGRCGCRRGWPSPSRRPPWTSVVGADQAGCRAGSRRARSRPRPGPRPARRSVSRRCSSSASGCSRVFEPSSCLPQRRTWRSRKPCGRPNSASPTASGSTACSAASTSTSPAGDRGGALGAERLELRGLAVRPSRRPAPSRRTARRAPSASAQCAYVVGTGTSVSASADHRGVLAAHVVGGRLHVAQRRPAHDPPRGAVGDLVGEVGLAAGDQRGRDRSPAISPGRSPSYQRRNASRSSPGTSSRQLRQRPPTYSSTLPCSRRIPASQRSVSAARAA